MILRHFSFTPPGPTDDRIQAKESLFLQGVQSYVQENLWFASGPRY
jgi:hypothetical protein